MVQIFIIVICCSFHLEINSLSLKLFFTIVFVVPISIRIAMYSSVFLVSTTCYSDVRIPIDLLVSFFSRYRRRARRISSTTITIKLGNAVRLFLTVVSLSLSYQLLQFVTPSLSFWSLFVLFSRRSFFKNL